MRYTKLNIDKAKLIAIYTKLFSAEGIGEDTLNWEGVIVGIQKHFYEEKKSISAYEEMLFCLDLDTRKWDDTKLKIIDLSDCCSFEQIGNAGDCLSF